MWTTGSAVPVEHCQHCKPQAWWLELEPGKAPCLAYSDFPPKGCVTLAKNRVIVVCRQCAMVIDLN